MASTALLGILSAAAALAAPARGPMQFMPATWAAYGLGGDVHDPRDAILGAADYLRAKGGGSTQLTGRGAA